VDLIHFHRIYLSLFVSFFFGFRRPSASFPERNIAANKYFASESNAK